jgi:hypothetical protein
MTGGCMTVLTERFVRAVDYARISHADQTRKHRNFRISPNCCALLWMGYPNRDRQSPNSCVVIEYEPRAFQFQLSGTLKM